VVSQPGLELATYGVRDVEEGPAAWDAGTLGVDLDSIAADAGRDASIARASAHVLRPGDDVRVANVLDVALPSVKPLDPAATFPGALGRLEPAGRGPTNRLDGVAVLTVADLAAAGLVDADDFPSSLVDMAGPAADRSAWSRTTNVVIEFVPQPGASAASVDAAIRRASLRAARDLAATTIGQEPGSIERVAASEPLGRGGDDELAAIAAIVQVASEGTFLDTFLYGRPVRAIDPVALDAAEVLDGALTAGAYDWAGARNPTAVYQGSALIRELLAADGVRCRFAGVIVALGYLSSAFDKQRSAMLSAELARRLGADGVICTTFETGNSQTDTMLTVRSCERLSIRTVALLAESNGGLTDHVPEADCLVSVGNEDDLAPAWTPSRVLGARPDAALGGRPVATVSYLGSVSQLGDMAWTAAS
jgi:Glycine/sarcosine/betaine reductase component B subunits